MPVAARAALVVALLYAFLVGISLLESGIGELGSGVQESLFSSVTNPIAGLCVVILATVLVQSSSVTTSTVVRSEEHTSELQSLMRISYAVFCLKKKQLN